MGRILRKKPTGFKKKKKPDDDKPSVESGSHAPSAAGAVATSGGDEARPAAPVLRRVSPGPSALPASAPADNMLTRAVQFLREVRIELKKVTWPTRQQAMGSTLVVIVLVVIISAFLGIVDLGLSTVIRAAFK